jgi:hypothetical protein
MNCMRVWNTKDKPTKSTKSYKTQTINKMNKKPEELCPHESKKRKRHSFRHSFIHSFTHSLIHSGIYSFRHSFIHTLPSLSYHRLIAIPNRSFQTVRASVSLFIVQCLLFSLRSSSSCLHLLPRIPVTPSFSSVFPPITCFKIQFLRKLWPNQVAFLPYNVHRISIFYLNLRNTSFFTRSTQLTSILLQRHIGKLYKYFWSAFRNVKLSAAYKKVVLQM